jgi:hypothetical protein
MALLGWACPARLTNYRPGRGRLKVFKCSTGVTKSRGIQGREGTRD